MDEGIKILLFGILAEKMDATEITTDEKGDTDSLLKGLQITYPDIAAVNFSIAVNKKIISENTILKAGDEIALLPAFSGG